ncbi:hypothetical protein CDD80_4313 [Ophiocordyceps camponoti-rufipedis]|uniref:Uncharacterized protein n=1 Tax=Ophiocordyceps camponoti-rufipedis TaxID=2004952 RepID=A0A2C5XZB1_9HYPO|nr:hypothetical protein CDD80_4313 [Ophiocordyceps camponoti-rufipedis]
MAAEEPPGYEEGEQPCGRLPGCGDYTLVMDGCHVYPAEPPSSFLYKLSSPVCQAAAKVYRVEKIRYRLSENDGEGRMMSRLDYIYDFQTRFRYHSFNHFRPQVIIEGKTSKTRTYKAVTISPSVTGWTSCSAEGHFKAKTSLRDRFSDEVRILWKNRAGALVAVEMRKRGGGDESLPRLEIKIPLGEQDLDLLVTCWAARLWKEAEKEMEQPLTWNGGRVG